MGWVPVTRPNIIFTGAIKSHHNPRIAIGAPVTLIVIVIVFNYYSTTQGRYLNQLTKFLSLGPYLAIRNGKHV